MLLINFTLSRVRGPTIYLSLGVQSR